MLVSLNTTTRDVYKWVPLKLLSSLMRKNFL